MIDYFSIYNQRKKELQDLLSKQSDYIGSIQPQTGTAVASDMLSASPNVDQSAIRSSLLQKIPSFIRNQTSRTAKQKLNQQSSFKNILFENAVTLAKQYGMSEIEARNFVQKYIEQRQEQEFQAGENAKKRESDLRMSNLANIYSQRGADLEGRYNMMPDQSGYLLRLLLGTGTAIGTAYALKNRKTPLQKLQKQQNIDEFNVESNRGLTPEHTFGYKP